nr:NAD(P)-dependent oxidoreductase [Tamaricihabitans halophyticus]
MRTRLASFWSFVTAGDEMGGRRLAFVGLGAMGAGMAHRLLESGYEVTVYNRTADKARPLVDAGARLVRTPAEVVDGADVVVLSLSDDAAVEQLLFGELVPAAGKGTTIVDTSAVSPEYARNAERRLALAGMTRVEAGVVGNPEMARNGTLRVFSAGTAEPAPQVRDILEALGGNVVHVGTTGSASVLKLCFNLLLGTQTVALAEAVSFGRAAGIDQDVLIDTLVNSGFGSVVLAFRASFMRSGEYQPAAFRVRLMEKDLLNALSEAATHGVVLPLVDRAASRFGDAADMGEQDSDAACMLRVQLDDRGMPPRQQESVSDWSN